MLRSTSSRLKYRRLVATLTTTRHRVIQNGRFSCRSRSTTTAEVRDDHEKRVAAAQALVKKRNQQRRLVPQDTKRQLLETNGLRTDDQDDPKKAILQQKRLAAERNTVDKLLIDSISHWLAKDPSFFKGTMEALDLNQTTTTTQVLLDQYKQLYYDSIPTFREQIQLYTHDDDGKKDCLREPFALLESAGFGDADWGKRFRQVRGYRNQQANLKRQISREQQQLQEQEMTIENTKLDLEEMTNRLQLLRKEKELLSQERKRLRKEQEEEDVEKAKFPSILSQAWSVVSSIVSTTMNPKSSDDDSKSIVLQPEAHNDLSAFFTKNSTVSRSVRRLEKRISKKKNLLQRLEGVFHRDKKKLQILELKAQKASPPLSDEEYNRALAVLEDVRTTICQELATHIRQQHETLVNQFHLLDSQTDLTKPQEWYSYARLDRRKIVFHGGPTNSGKTYTALERLREAKKGLYLGPLRLLAAEVYETLTVDGVYTNLFTGQEQRNIPFSTHSSATVEMTSTQEEFDVVVVDEIQMIAEPARGHAWTRALLGLRCKEIHVCGGWEAKPIVEKIAKACGDDFETHKYERFSKLQVASSSLSSNPTKEGAYQQVQPGDCVVAFSRNDIFAIKREIETTTKYKCCVIYGKLPPQTRADQARRFNDPDSGYDVLVASDAIGMGLNLNIRRIIFNSIFKFNGEDVVRLSHSDIKQISGRAGRRNSPYPNGEVTCRDPRDLPYIRECLETEIQPIERAGLLPTAAHIEKFSEALGAYDLENRHTKLHEVIQQFSAMAKIRGDFFLCRQTEMRSIAKYLRNVPLHLEDAYTMCLSPTTDSSMKILKSFAEKYTRGEVAGLPLRSVPKKARSFEDLSYLCGLYADADLFLWLQNKFPPSNAVEQQAAIANKETTLEFINEALAHTENLKLSHSYIRQAAHHRANWEFENGEGTVSDDDDEDMDDEDYSEEGRTVYM